MDMTNNNSPKILYYGAGWPTNIGNAFIDFGAMAVLKLAAPNAEVSFASEMPRWFFEHSVRDSFSSRVLNKLSGKNPEDKKTKALDIAALCECDLVAFSGMAMCEEFVRVNGPTVIELSKRGIPVLLLGTGGLHYDDKEKKIFSDFIKELNPLAYISRDDRSYSTYSHLIKNNYKGIDCGFFTPEYYKPLKLTLKNYVAMAFDTHDELPESNLNLNGRTLIRAHHDCWGPSSRSYVSKEKTLISDIPQDYLTLYANAQEVHTDRVHASVATLAYGNKTRLYSPTPRGSLFDAVGVGDIRDKLVQLDMALFNEKKQNEVAYLKELIETHVMRKEIINT